MARKNGDWTIKNSRKIYENGFIKVVEDDIIQPDGNDGKYATIEMKPGICVLPVDEAGNVYLTRQFRYALGAESLEATAGGIENGEPLENAKRETREEMGIEAEEWISLGASEIDTSIIKGSANFFVARGLTFVKPKREGTEKIKLVKISFDEAVEKVLSGEIVHSASCILILKAKLKLFSS